MRIARSCLIVMVLIAATSCDKMLATKDAQRSLSQTSIYSVYMNLNEPRSDALVAKAVDEVDRIPPSLTLDDRFKCAYETMVDVDFARKLAGRPLPPGSPLMTDDDLSRKAVSDALLLSDQPIPETAVTDDFVTTHFAEYAVPSESDAVFAYAVWFASYTRAVTNKFGFSGITGPDADRWLTKGRSKQPADKTYRRRANLGIGELRCYEILGKLPARKEPSTVDPKMLAAVLTRGVE